MKLLVFLAILSVAVAYNPADNGETILSPSVSDTQGNVYMRPWNAPPLATLAPKPMQLATVEQPPRLALGACGCCGQATCGCCTQAPPTIAPEITEPPLTIAPCGCAPVCFPTCMCPNTCGCCQTHITPEILTPGPPCNCCHLDSCGCCVRETVAPEEKIVHVAPELVDPPKCPCMGLSSPCACATNANLPAVTSPNGVARPVV